MVMDPVAEFFVDNIVVVYFFYGLAFFIMGLIVWLESNRTSEFRISRAFGLLAGFGIIQSDGTFVLGTYAEQDGAVVGPHRITLYGDPPYQPA